MNTPLPHDVYVDVDVDADGLGHCETTWMTLRAAQEHAHIERSALTGVKYVSPALLKPQQALARGGTGEVFSAIVMYPLDADGMGYGPDVAIKVLREGRSDDAFVSEIAANVNVGKHPNIVPLLGVVPPYEKRGPILVFPLMTATLQSSVASEHAKKRQTPVPACLRATTTLAHVHDLASALSHMHDRAIVHADVRSSNVFFDARGKLHLGDLGFATLVGSEVQPLKWQERRKYAHFPDDDCPSPAYDVFSMGVIMLEAFFRAVLYGRAELERATAEIRSDVYVSSPHLCVRHVAYLAGRCMNADPHLRPAARDVSNMCARALAYTGKDA